VDYYILPRSFIKVTDFENIKDLVKYIYKAVNDQMLYKNGKRKRLFEISVNFVTKLKCKQFIVLW
ncbi:12890_t:CDS:1, partial [Gigaspora margarita]